MMKPKSRLMALELLSGLFGWLWIGAILAALILAGLATFSSWSWWYVLYAIIAGGVAKWLARGFLDNQKRVGFENAMKKSGMSAEEAGQAWVDAYAGTNASSSIGESKVNNSLGVVSDYALFIEQSPAVPGMTISDVKCLPHRKETILDAICAEIADETDDHRVEALKATALSLADYQVGIGDRPITRLGVDFTSIDISSLNAADTKALASKIAKNRDRDRFKSYEVAVNKDMVDILSRVQDSELSRR